MRRDATHEHLEADDEIIEGSPRAFGFVFAAVFALAAAWPLAGGEPVRTWSLIVAAALLVAALVAPGALGPFSRAWQRVGVLLHHIVNPIVMGFLFYLAITPFGLVRQWLGKGVTARLHPDPRVDTYWMSRDAEPPSRMTNQF